MCKKGDCWSTRYTKEERDEAREGFKRRVHQYLVDNDINNNSDKDTTAIALTSTPTTVPTTTSRNFFYDDNKPPDLTINIDFLNCHFNDNG